MRKRSQLLPRLTLGLALCGLALALSGLVRPCSPVRFLPPTDLEPTRGYILISLDTVAADHLGTYGYERDTSPFLDSMARRGAVFENAFVQFPMTLHSHTSIFTGLYPDQNGVVTPFSVMSPRIPTIPELFHAAGYTTGGFTEGGPVGGRLGFDRGFARFDDTGGPSPTQMEDTFGRARRFLRSLGPDEPFLLFVHTFAAHTPYQPPPPFDALYRDVPLPAGCPAELSHVGQATRSQTFDAACASFHRARYDAGLTYVDAVLRSFFAELDALGLTDQVTVIVTADHGEEFAQHGRMEHGQLYHENLHVPLLVQHPDLRGRQRIPDVARSIDIAPTLFDLAGIEPPETLSGRSLVPSLLNRGDEGATESFALNDFGSQCRIEPDWNTDEGEWDYRANRSQSLYRLQDGRLWHLLQLVDCPSPADPTAQARAGEPKTTHLELYETSADRAEAHDLCGERADLCQELAARLEQYRFSPVAPAEAPLRDADYQQRLQEMGYIDPPQGSTAPDRR